ncbi:MAG: DUF4349 domain-containing protein [Solirubrobacterales bacterium]
MNPHDENETTIESLLIAERPEPRSEFTAELDARAAERFVKPRAPRRRAFKLRYALGAASFVAVAAIAVSASGVLDEAGRPEDVGRSPGVADQLEKPSPANDRSGEAALRFQGDPARPAPGDERRIARTADLALSTSPESVRDVADGVVDVTHRYSGFVVSSSVSSGDGETASGEFELKLSARTLQPALDDLSELGHVRSLTEGTDDITRRFTTGRERIEDLTAKRERLRAKLDAADPADEPAIRVELRMVRDSLATTRTELAGASERVRFVPVHVSIVADAAEADTGWTIGDALDDAVRVLEVAVGITLIALAGSVPVAIVAALLWLAARAWMRSRRERALDEQPG